MAKKQIKQSDLVGVRRSQINLNPYNPKRHSDKKINEQKKNLLRVGLLGGITWNRISGNLIDGHRRIMAMDLHYGYDGTPENDYTIKVSAVELDEKQEKEQMTYMALGNTKADYSLIATYLPDIDASLSGIDDYDLEQIRSFLPDPTEIEIESFDDLIAEDPEETQQNQQFNKAQIKESKQKAQEIAEERYADQQAYITVSFANADEKRMFCELIRISEKEMFVKGSDVLSLIE